MRLAGGEQVAESERDQEHLVGFGEIQRFRRLVQIISELERIGREHRHPILSPTHVPIIPIIKINKGQQVGYR